MEDNLLSFVDELPEAQAVQFLTVLREFLDAVRRATTVAEVNVAAGIALQGLERLS